VRGAAVTALVDVTDETLVFAPRPIHDLLPPPAGVTDPTGDVGEAPTSIVVIGSVCIGCQELDGVHGATLAGRPCPFRIGGPMDGGGQQDRYGRARR
jgi:hypothetical protein